MPPPSSGGWHTAPKAPPSLPATATASRRAVTQGRATEDTSTANPAVRKKDGSSAARATCPRMPSSISPRRALRGGAQEQRPDHGMQPGGVARHRARGDRHEDAADQRGRVQPVQQAAAFAPGQQQVNERQPRNQGGQCRHPCGHGVRHAPAEQRVDGAGGMRHQHPAVADRLRAAELRPFRRIQGKAVSAPSNCPAMPGCERRNACHSSSAVTPGCFGKRAVEVEAHRHEVALAAFAVVERDDPYPAAVGGGAGCPHRRARRSLSPLQTSTGPGRRASSALPARTARPRRCIGWLGRARARGPRAGRRSRSCVSRRSGG